MKEGRSALAETSLSRTTISLKGLTFVIWIFHDGKTQDIGYVQRVFLVIEYEEYQ